ncbi:MAG: hypothetical protein LQ342_003262 [Letrouitia transgressa]|nr:MAG: hypothetical protein LQ342_003262 [Letrouitia transgressa]
MGRMNYTKRKTAGLKLGQSVAKDLIKRIPPSSGSKAAFRDPTVELDVSGKALTHEGFKVVADALARSIQHNEDRGPVVRLEELCLRDNKLHAGSLRALAGVIRLAAHDLRDLDLSDNDVSITTREECDAWETFLKSFARCCMLRRLDLSGNPLGPKAFEILTRVYSQEPPINLLGPEASEHELGHLDVGQREPKQGLSRLEKEVRDLSVISDPALSMSEGDSTISVRSDLEQGIRTGLKILELSVAEHEQLLEADLRPESPISPNYWGKHQAPRVTDSSPANRSRSITTIAAESGQREHGGPTNPLTELQRARSRVQVNALRDSGLGSNDLWQTSLKMLRVCRSLCSAKLDKTRRVGPQAGSTRSRKERLPDHPDFPPLPTMTTKPFIGYLDPFVPSLEVKNLNRTTYPKCKESPKVKTPSPRPLHELPSPSNPEMSTVQDIVRKQYRTSLPCGFTEQIWCRIVSLAVEADEIMSSEQQLSVLRCALDRNTLVREIELLGKSESAQIWKALERMGCLAYQVEG